MRPIPPKLRNKMSEDRYYKTCCLSDETCSGRIEWHHNLIYQGRQLNEQWCILPLCHAHHLRADHSDVKQHLNWIMLNRATDTEILNVSKAINYMDMKNRLQKIYG